HLQGVFKIVHAPGQVGGVVGVGVGAPVLAHDLAFRRDRAVHQQVGDIIVRAGVAPADDGVHAALRIDVVAVGEVVEDGFTFLERGGGVEFGVQHQHG